MFDKSNIELDEKHSTKRRKTYLLRDQKGEIKLTLVVYRYPEIDALTFTFQCIESYGLNPVIDVISEDNVVLRYERNTFFLDVTPDTFDRFIEDTCFAREAATYVMEHMDEF